MVLNEEMLLVNEANYFAHDCINRIPLFISKSKLARTIINVCNAFYAARNQAIGDQQKRANEINSSKQRLAIMICTHCEDKKDPPYKMIGGVYDVGNKTEDDLAKELAERIFQIVASRKLLARNIHEVRAEYEDKLGILRDEIETLKDDVNKKDSALLAAAERIAGQSDILTKAAGRSPDRRPCENIHPSYSGMCKYCPPPSEQDIADQYAE